MNEMKQKVVSGILVTFACGFLLVLVIFLFLFWIIATFSFLQTSWIIIPAALLSILIPLIINFFLIRDLSLNRSWIYYFLLFPLALFFLYFILTRTNLVFYHVVGNTRSAKTLSGVRQIASALELYRKDHPGYPQTLREMLPTYIGEIPAPIYAQKKVCAADQAILGYHLVSKDSFSLEFCLDEKTGGYTAGLHWLTEKGIK